MSVSRKVLAAFAATGLGVAATAPAFADTLVEAGRLTCIQSPADAVRDPTAVRCVFTSADGRVREYYAGYMDRGPLSDDGAGRVAVSWTVTTRTRTFMPGSLAGIYDDGDAGGSERSADGDILMGGTNRVVTLRRHFDVEQPVAPGRLTLRRIGMIEERTAPETEIEIRPAPQWR